MSRSIPDREIKTLIALSGGVCAFPGCGKQLIEPGNAADPSAFLGEMAHIVADSRQGPRGDSPMSDEERDRHSNLLLLCGDHHKTIDSQPLTYSVSVLRTIKADHECRIRQATAPDSAPPATELKQEIIHSSLLPLTHLPFVVFSAPCHFTDRQEDEVKRRIRYPDDRSVLVRFLIREGKLYSFHDLRDPNGPFSQVIELRAVERCRSSVFWQDAESHRRFVTLLNRAMYKHTATLGVRFDPTHWRYYFPAEAAGKERVARYRPLNMASGERNVAWEPKRRSTGEGKGFWWHLAADLRFHRMAGDQWCLSIRPERHLTSDGLTPLPAEKIGRRVTSMKARMFNDKYLSEVNFWRDFLANGSPRFVLDFGSQSAIVSTEFINFDVKWPGIPSDDLPFKNQSYEEDLFSLAGLGSVVRGEDLGWENDEDDEFDTDPD
jgi:hypothetical protein